MIEICPGELTIGARVVCSAPVGGNDLRNEEGEVLRMVGAEALVRFGPEVDGHNGFDDPAYAHMAKTLWWVAASTLRRIG